MTHENSSRLCPERKFPAYTFVPGEQPHPYNDEDGHSYGEAEVIPPALDPRAWRESEAYRYGIDLFNFGYYWEAHEIWEGLWHAAGHTGTTADFLKGLIKLAAAGVKARQRNPHGIRKHSQDATWIFINMLESEETFAGMDLDSLVAFGEKIAEQAEDIPASDSEKVEPIFPKSLPVVEEK